ncbi:MAG TPA: hypothetical protein PLI05_02975 [Methanotrichaceae archaeon]|nr:hypothetical protein [Methanotrichaceae archaeon]HQI90637.1 hypothetical protein [Methanotrichaceae archaeon]HQJ28082.1 hypothetical protein [Methanotrichaceae archaeon]
MENDQSTNQNQTRTFTQDEVNRFLADEKRAWQAREAELKAKADKLDQYEAQTKTEIKKAQEAIEKETVARAAAEADRDALRLDWIKASSKDN